MKTLTVRLPEMLAAQIEAESRGRKISKSDVVRERLTRVPRRSGPGARGGDPIEDLIGSLDHLPADLSEHKKVYLGRMGYGRKRSG